MTKAEELLGAQGYMANEIEREERVPKLRRSLAPRATLERQRALDFLRDLRAQAAADLKEGK